MDLATMLERVASPDTETRTQAEALIAQVMILYSSSLTYISTQSTRSDASECPATAPNAWGVISRAREWECVRDK